MRQSVGARCDHKKNTHRNREEKRTTHNGPRKVSAVCLRKLALAVGKGVVVSFSACMHDRCAVLTQRVRFITHPPPHDVKAVKAVFIVIFTLARSHHKLPKRASCTELRVSGVNTHCIPLLWAPRGFPLLYRIWYTMCCVDFAVWYAPPCSHPCLGYENPSLSGPYEAKDQGGGSSPTHCSYRFAHMCVSSSRSW